MHKAFILTPEETREAILNYLVKKDMITIHGRTIVTVSIKFTKDETRVEILKVKPLDTEAE